MQLIQLPEPAAVDIKKTMSTIRESLETNQLNRTITDIGIDKSIVTNNISPNKTDMVSKTSVDVKNENTINKQWEEEIKDLDGMPIANGDAQTENQVLELDNNHIVTENIENGSSVNGQSNGSSTFGEHCKSPANILVDVFSTTVDKRTNLEDQISNDFKNVIVVEAKKVTSDLKIIDVSVENSPSVNDDLLDDTEADDYIEKVCDADKLKNIHISVGDQDKSENALAFSPNSDTGEKEVNISAQLQQLEDDASIEDNMSHSTDIKIATGHIIQKEVADIELENDAALVKKGENEIQANTSSQKKIGDGDIIEKTEEINLGESHNQIVDSLTNEKSEVSTDKQPIDEKIDDQKNILAATSVEKDENEIQATTSSQNEINDRDKTEKTEEKDVGGSFNKKVDSPIIEASVVSTEKLPVDNNLDKEKIIPGNIFEIRTDEEPENCSIPLEDSLVTEGVEDIASMEVVDDHDITDKANDDASEVAIENQSVKNDFEDINSDKTMEVEDISPVSIEEKLDNSNEIDTDVDNTATVPKYIKVRNFSDMTDQKVMNNDETFEISQENQPTKKDLIQLNEIMDVDDTDVMCLVTPENSTRSDTDSNKINIIDQEKAKDTTEKNKNEALEVHEEKKFKDNDNVIMEIDDLDEVPIVEKPGYETADIVDAQNIIEVENDQETAKLNVIINITDKEDEEFNKSKYTDGEVKNDERSKVISIDDSVKDAENLKKPSDVEVMHKEVMKAIEKKTKSKDKIPEKTVEERLPVVCKLSNTMDILSDDEDDNPVVKSSLENNKESDESKKIEEENKCINIDDDDDNDIMFIEDTNSQGSKDEEENKSVQQIDKAESQTNEATDNKINPDTGRNEKSPTNIEDMAPKIIVKDDSTSIEIDSQTKEDQTIPIEPSEIKESQPPLITKSFLKSVTKNLADMTRNELEDFCILKLVESVVDKSNLNEIKNKMKTMAITVEDLRKKTLALTKQNRDLQVVVKTVQEDQKKRSTNPMMPMKITRSVGMQVVLTGTGGDKSILKKKLSMPIQTPPIIPVRPVRNIQSPKTQKQIANNIPVPRLVPASSPTAKSPAIPVNTVVKPATPTVRNTTPQRPEKRSHTKVSSPASSVTVDLTDDEPPAKVITKNPTPPVRLVPSQNLMPVKNKPQFGPTSNSPRKVYIPISSNNQNIRPGTGVIRNFVSPTLRPRPPSVVRMQTVRLSQAPSTNRHPAPLPDAMKQYQPPTWKALPPAPDLKLSKVDNGIVISWKFEGYQQDTYEEVASFQLYAYQETPAPPSTALWKKIGDIKALPLPMACTLTQFMSGFKYYFAVRAIDVRSRIGPFSLPGSIMLISKS